ncbi:MAG TPA: PIN domain-containing protein [Solirubrobacteraceae bacterium]|nr:PIN domain-containing protein [Solirubrobacteraceae bacterium]
MRAKAERPGADAEGNERAYVAKRPARAVDSSVAIAAILADSEQHTAAQQALADSDLTIAHVAVETYSVLTRIPPPHRVDVETAAAIVEARLPPERVTLDAAQHVSTIHRLASARIGGGASYDGLIALTALEHDLQLISQDRRAARTYLALGVRFQLLE